MTDSSANTAIRLKWKSSGSFTLVLSMALVACGGSPEEGANGGASTGETVVIADPAEAVSLDPADDTSVAGDARKNLFYETLMRRTEDGDLDPVLATEWEQVDDVTYEFTLRDGVTFHDGEQLTAEDVVFSISRLIEGDYQDTVNIEPYFEAVEEVDDQTVRVSSYEPLGTFLPRIANIYIVPADYVEEVGDDEFSRNPVGTGPFEFESWTRDSELHATRFEDYWGESAAAPGITYRVMSESSARMSALTSGEIDVGLQLPVEVTAQLEGADCCDIIEAPTNRTFFIGMNTNEEPLDDPLVRQALNYAIDTETLAESIFDGHVAWHGEEGNSLMYGDSITGFPEDLEGFPYDPDRAMELLAEAGYPDGFDLDFAGPRGRYPNDAILVEAMAEMLEDVGINVALDISDWGTYWPTTQAGDQPGLWVLTLGNFSWDAEYYMTTYLSSLGRGYYATDEMDERIFDQRHIIDSEERTDELEDITRTLVIEEAPWIFMWDLLELHGVSENVDGFDVTLNQRIDEKAISINSNE